MGALLLYVGCIVLGFLLCILAVLVVGIAVTAATEWAVKGVTK